MSITTKILQLENSETVTKTNAGNTYSTVTLTHLKMTSLKVEMSRPDAGKEPFVEMWFAKGYFDEGVWIEPDFVSGMQVLITGDTWAFLMNSDVQVSKLIEVEALFYQYCLAANLIPPGTLQDFIV